MQLNIEIRMEWQMERKQYVRSAQDRCVLGPSYDQRGIHAMSNGLRELNRALLVLDRETGFSDTNATGIGELSP